MQSLENIYYRVVEFFSRLTGDQFTADYYAAKREENQ